MRTTLAAALGVALAAVTAIPAAVPPGRINYQGVLRDAAGQPLNGPHNFIFRFFDDPTFGNELLIDLHLAGPGGQIMVTNGLFDATLFGGVVLDGSSSRTYTTAVEVFSLNTNVWMQIEVGSDTMPMEILSPRVQVISSAYAQSAAFAQNAATLDGRFAGEFLDFSATPQTKYGPLGLYRDIYDDIPALDVFAPYHAARFSSNGSGVAFAGIDNYGIYATGSPSIVGYNPNTTSGILGASGIAVGGYAASPAAAGYFDDYDNNTSVWLGSGGEGVHSRGSIHGGLFESSTDPYAKAWLAGDPTPPGGWLDSTTWGIWADGGYSPWNGEGGGGYFRDVLYGSYAKVAHENYGVQGFGYTMGGYFKDLDSSGEVRVASGDHGIYAFGSFVAGAFSHPNLTSFWANVATSTHKITGTGAVSFVQNHPHDPDRVIVYAAPEGDEVATYTRGSARLHGGRARVALGETFALVTNPDIGLTAHLTPRGEAVPLAVESISTGELVVSGPQGSNTEFDYLVHGLRIGFEEAAVIQPKDREARLPDQAAFASQVKGDESLKSHRAFDRFARMEQEMGRPSSAATARGDAAATPGAAALRAAIDAAGVNEVGRRKDYGPEMVSSKRSPEEAEADLARREELRERRNAEAREERPERPGAPLLPAGPRPALPPAPVDSDEAREPADGPPAPGRLVVTLPAAGDVRPFDLLAAGDAADGSVRASSVAADRTVVGVALRLRADGGVDLALAGIVSLRADATSGPIAPGDLLAASATPGHAMRSPDGAPGTIVAKALEPLEGGTGVIRVLLMPR